MRNPLRLVTPYLRVKSLYTVHSRNSRRQHWPLALEYLQRNLAQVNERKCPVRGSLCSSPQLQQTNRLPSAQEIQWLATHRQRVLILRRPPLSLVLGNRHTPNQDQHPLTDLRPAHILRQVMKQDDILRRKMHLLPLNDLMLLSIPHLTPNLWLLQILRLRIQHQVLLSRGKSILALEQANRLIQQRLRLLLCQYKRQHHHGIMFGPLETLHVVRAELQEWRRLRLDASVLPSTPACVGPLEPDRALFTDRAEHQRA